MPTLDWIGKKAVLNHHRQVPYHLLRCDNSLSVGDPGSGNLLVQGDNLLALKALLPYYAGQVKCIYIDPPYNTGNENWVYNDAVNSPEMKKWLGKVVGGEAEDLSRHDKWLCMMYPRLALLREFLREDGMIFINLDDNEAAHARCMLDEIYGPRCFLATIAWEKRYTRSNNAKLFYSLKDTILVYRKSVALALLREPRTEKADALYTNPDNDPRGPWMTSSYVNPATKKQRPNLVYPIKNPNTGEPVEHQTHAWKYELAQHRIHEEENRLWWGANGRAKYPRLKIFLCDSTRGMVPVDVWHYQDTGTTDDGGSELEDIFGHAAFDNPKPTSLLQRVIRLATGPSDIVMDSFAGSGTTGHAVLKANKADGGNRRFILVEMEPGISRDVCAKRLISAIQGYMTNTGGKKATPVQELGGGFRYCTLAEPLFDETGNIRAEVKFADLASHVYFTETGEPLAIRRNKPPALPGERNGKKASPGRAATATGAAPTGERNGKKASPGSAGGLLSPRSAGGLSSPLIGVCKGTAYYLLFNGVLGDKRPDGGNVLTGKVLGQLPPHDGPKVVYGEGCRLGAARLAREGIVFKQVPYEIKTA